MASTPALVGGGLLLLVAVGIGGYFLGQSAEPPVETPAPPAAAAVAPAADQWVTASNHQNWLLRCRTDVPTQGPDSCVGLLELVNADSNNLVLAWLVAPGADGSLVGTFQTPLGIQVGSGIDLQFGDAPVRKIGFASCGTQYCLASTLMDEAFIAEASAAERMQAVIVTQEGQAVTLGIPLAGFTDIIAQFP